MHVSVIYYETGHDMDLRTANNSTLQTG